MQNFTEFALDADLLETLQANKFETPTPIQSETLPKLLEGPTDFLGLAATGTGKTLAFSLPMIQRIDAKKRYPQSLILCPTRELAQQVSQQVNLLSKSRRLTIATVFGGAGYGDQIKSFRAGAQVVVATPGRLVDHLDRGTVDLSRVQIVILDEADEMISMGFKDDLEMILSKVREAHQDSTPQPKENENSEADGAVESTVASSTSGVNIWLFSATMSAEVKRVAHRFLNNPKSVQINSKAVLSGTVEQLYYMTKEADKPEVLAKIIDAHDDFYGLVFCQTKLLVQNLTQLLQSRGYKVDSLHGDRPQTERERILARFRARDIQIVICTDVAARGLDVKELTHVVNYSIPRELENYIHRIGRTGRSGSKGIAISLVTPTQLPIVGRVERLTKVRIERGTIPSNAEVAKKKVSRVISKYKNAENVERAVSFVEQNFADELKEMSTTEFFARVLSVQLPELFQVREVKSPKLMSNGERASDQRARGIRPQRFGDREDGYRGRDERGYGQASHQSGGENRRRDFSRDSGRDTGRDSGRDFKTEDSEPRRREYTRNDSEPRRREFNREDSGSRGRDFPRQDAGDRRWKPREESGFRRETDAPARRASRFEERPARSYVRGEPFEARPDREARGFKRFSNFDESAPHSAAAPHAAAAPRARRPSNFSPSDFSTKREGASADRERPARAPRSASGDSVRERFSARRATRSRDT